MTITAYNNPNILIHVFLITNLAYVGYLGMAQPHDTTLSRRMEFLNESALQLITYHLALFPLSPTLEDEELCGFSMIGVVCAVFAGNLGVMIVVTIVGLKRKCQLKKMR